jgi:hypothetical protein
LVAFKRTAFTSLKAGESIPGFELLLAIKCDESERWCIAVKELLFVRDGTTFPAEQNSLPAGLHPPF